MTFSFKLIGKIQSLKEFEELLGKNLVLFCNIREMSGKPLIIIAHLYVIYLFSNIYIVERSMEYQINDERSDCPTCLSGVFQQ